MREGLTMLQQLQEQYSRNLFRWNCWNTEIIEALELGSLIVVGQMILTSALNRQKVAASFPRGLLPARRCQFSQAYNAYYSPAGIDLQYQSVTITLFEPQERK